MNTKHSPLPAILDAAINSGIIARHWNAHRAYMLARARRAYARNLKEPGDCAGDPALLACLAIAEAIHGRGAGWIPLVQSTGCKLADLEAVKTLFRA